MNYTIIEIIFNRFHLKNFSFELQKFDTYIIKNNNKKTYNHLI